MIFWENNEEDTNKSIQTPKLFDEFVANDKKINKIFNSAWQKANLIFDLSELFL